MIFYLFHIFFHFSNWKILLLNFLLFLRFLLSTLAWTLQLHFIGNKIKCLIWIIYLKIINRFPALFTIILHYFELVGHREFIRFTNHFHIGLSNIFDLFINLRKSHKLFLILLKIKTHTVLKNNYGLMPIYYTPIKHKKKVLGSPEKEVNLCLQVSLLIIDSFWILYPYFSFL